MALSEVSADNSALAIEIFLKNVPKQFLKTSLFTSFVR